MTSNTTLAFKHAAVQVLDQAGEPLHYRDITERALAQKLISTDGKTPEATMNAQLSTDLLRKGSSSAFVRVRPGVFGLRPWLQDGRATEMPEHDVRVRVPHYPQYDLVRRLLPVLNGIHRQKVTSLRSAIFAHRGTPQQNVDWSSPDTWIDEKLQGDHRELARKIWEGTSHQLNPRHMSGCWLLATAYELLCGDSGDTLQVTDRGRNFIEEPTGEVVREIDESEGLLKLLAMVAELGPATRSDLLLPFAVYLAEVSNVKADTSVKAYLWARLRNLTERGLIERSSQSYRITEAGLSYLDLVSIDDESGPEGDDQKIRRLVDAHTKQIRARLAEKLRDMDPYEFEHLICSLLQAMGYEDVEVTAPSGDGGVDVIARIQLGITEVREVVQVKKHAKNIQRHILDALRGSLHRFQAVRGTIITTSDFAKGTQAAAFELGTAPITLINGEKLIDLLIEHRVGVRKKPIEVLEIDDRAFASDDLAQDT